MYYTLAIILCMFFYFFSAETKLKGVSSLSDEPVEDEIYYNLKIEKFGQFDVYAFRKNLL